ncbi:MAG: transposase [Candidatus Hydrogenedentes bacterium]|nr:transposase [Candidatus Hydrogenedentota bacterium]
MAQSLAQVHLHLIFSTKNRVPHLAESTVRNEMFAYLASTFNGLNAPAHIICGMPDHVHALFSLPRDKDIAGIVAEVKRSSSIWVKKRDNAYKLFQWQSGYGVFSVSHSNLGRVARYIRGQEEHHRTLSFQDEFRRFLKRHGVAFDERYVWD